MSAEILVTPDRFIVVRDGDTVSITSDRKKAERIARHFVSVVLRPSFG
jgi:hypothetical protein